MTIRARTQELTLVFTLKDIASSSVAIFGIDEMKLQPRTGSIAPLDALNILIERIHALGIDTTFTEGAKTLSARSLLKKIERKGTWGHVQTAELSFQYGVAGSYEHCFVSIREKICNAAGSWEEWAMPFVVSNGFVEGWVVDVEYKHWQNAKDPMEYEIAGRDFSHLPMKSNGLPRPLLQMEIDTSNNPGRWVLRSGYVEAIGATMWLSKLFWDRVGRNRSDRVRSTDWIRSADLAKDVVEICVSEHCFVSEETADLQHRLRELLYA